MKYIIISYAIINITPDSIAIEYISCPLNNMRSTFLWARNIQTKELKFLELKKTKIERTLKTQN